MKTSWFASVRVALLWPLVVPWTAVSQERQYGYGPGTLWESPDPAAPAAASFGVDVNRDGMDDIVRCYRGARSGDVTVSRSDGGSFTGEVTWLSSFATAGELPLTGDFNGDARADLAMFIRSTRGGAEEGDVYVALSTGSGFLAPVKWHDYFCVGSETPLTGDFDGDGDDDIATLTGGGAGNVFVAISDRTAFLGTGVLWASGVGLSGTVTAAGDVDGDRACDLVSFVRSTQPAPVEGDVFVARSTRASFAAPAKWHDFFSINGETPLVADVNGDGMADVITLTTPDFRPVGYVALSTGTEFSGTGAQWLPSLGFGGSTCVTGRFNRDLNADLAAVTSILGTTFTSVSLLADHARTVDGLLGRYGYSTLYQSPAVPPPSPCPANARPAVLAYVTYPGGVTANPGRTLSYFDQLVFGPNEPNLAAYFQENSGGRFTLWRAGAYSLSFSPAAGADGRTMTIQQLAAAGFNFAPYDTNGDNIVDNSELFIIQVDNGTASGGQNAGFPATVPRPGGGTIAVNSTIAAAGVNGRFDLYGHEVSHSLDTRDLYSSGCYVQNLSMMHCNAGTSTPVNFSVHLDAWHKMRLGWIAPRMFDIRHYPGGAWVTAPVAAAAESDPPVLLYDSSRPEGEYYLAEFRSGVFAVPGGSRWNESPGVAAPASYDSSLAFGQSNRAGFAVYWTRKNAADGELNNIPVTVDAGPNGILQTVPVGDDVITGTSITPGPNSDLDTLIVGVDDRINYDWACYSSLTPRNLVTRNGRFLRTRTSGLLQPQWYDRTNLPVALRVDEGAAGSSRGYIQWGADFASFITRQSRRTVEPGGTLRLDGDLGVRTGPLGMTPLLRGAGGTVPLEVLSWTPAWTELRVPPGTATGSWRLSILNDSGQRISNVLSLTVGDPFRDFMIVSYGQLLPPALMLPYADADLDGTANLVEWIFGTDPGYPDPPPDVWMPPQQPGNGGQLTAVLDAFKLEFAGVTAEFSTKLTGDSWTEIPFQIEEPNSRGESTVVAKFPPNAGTIGFMRLRFGASYSGGTGD